MLRLFVCCLETKRVARERKRKDVCVANTCEESDFNDSLGITRFLWEFYALDI